MCRVIVANRHLTRLSATPSALGWDADQIAWCTDHEVEANMWDRRRFIASGLGAARYVRSSIAICITFAVFWQRVASIRSRVVAGDCPGLPSTNI